MDCPHCKADQPSKIVDSRAGNHESVPHKLYAALGPGFKWRVRRCEECLQHWETVEVDADSLPGLLKAPRQARPTGFNYFKQPKYGCQSCGKELPHMIVWGALAQAQVVGHHRFQCPHCKATLQAGNRPPESGKKG